MIEKVTSNNYIFFSYNRDELCPIKIGDKALVDILGDTILNNEKLKTKVYFDNIQFFELDKQISDNIENKMGQCNTIVLLVSDKKVFYGWTEKELILAIKNKRPIYRISIKKFIKYFIKKNYSFVKLINKYGKKCNY